METKTYYFDLKTILSKLKLPLFYIIGMSAFLLVTSGTMKIVFGIITLIIFICYITLLLLVLVFRRNPMVRFCNRYFDVRSGILTRITTYYNDNLATVEEIDDELILKFKDGSAPYKLNLTQNSPYRKNELISDFEAVIERTNNSIDGSQ